MPARMWRNGIHAFLELLRQQLPDSYEHMLAFVYIAYSTMALLLESVPSFRETWIECLGDLARYRMAIEEVDMRVRQVWSEVARRWYNNAADLSPNVGRIQHHLAVLARPDSIKQLSLYSKALVSVVPFINARESIMLLFGPFLDKDKAEAECQKYAPVESSMVTAWGTAFTRGSVSGFIHHTKTFLSGLDGHISRITDRWKTQGPEVASSLIAGILDYGSDENHLWKLFTSHAKTIQASLESIENLLGQQQAVVNDLPPFTKKLHKEYWRSVNANRSQDFPQAAAPIENNQDYTFTSSDEVTSHVLPVFHRATSIVATKPGDRNTVPFICTILAFIWSFSFIPGALIYIEPYIPWLGLVMFLNTSGRSGVKVAEVESEQFEKSLHGLGRQLPEDFLIRGLAWSPYYYPSNFFTEKVSDFSTEKVVDEEDRQLELPSHTTPRAQRCLWLGVRIATVSLLVVPPVSALTKS
jgi:Est1 DNA/RNA binding domain